MYCHTDEGGILYLCTQQQYYYQRLLRRTLQGSVILLSICENYLLSLLLFVQFCVENELDLEQEHTPIKELAVMP